ncbi:hypothetical protein BB559_000836 [Furculomyces boomerangus]|uniref:Histone deacetylase interacting domain-containing protein n=2 Tax=Harpellales TaxID=61421 RepID=A0A2T9Z3X9_9FUNG|nr:hypothetical protein BB559_000836 [Furculomyces boomerangus]PWA03394.1 hypothetical protein BB558_000447 [Smittium angustum]
MPKINSKTHFPSKLKNPKHLSYPYNKISLFLSKTNLLFKNSPQKYTLFLSLLKNTAKGDLSAKNNLIAFIHSNPTLVPDFNSFLTPHPPTPKLPFKNWFFSQIKLTLEQKPIFLEFLTLLNRYNQNLISTSTLIQLATPFLSKRPDLLKTLTTLVSHNQQQTFQLPDSPGPSYKAIDFSDSSNTLTNPENAHLSELNNAWMSHPTWASEKNEFIYHKKNPYEEEIFNIEQERHKLQMNIETNNLLIKRLQTYLKNPASIHLDSITSSALTKVALKKVYDTRRTTETLLALKTNPQITASIVLKKLLIKDKEWKKVKDNFMPIWNDLQTKNYYKSLDHQPKVQKDVSVNLINEVIAAKHEKLLNYNYNSWDIKLPSPNKNTTRDAANLVASYIKNNYKRSNSRAIQTLLKTTMHSIFSLFMEIEGDEFLDDWPSPSSLLYAKKKEFGTKDPTYPSSSSTKVSVVIPQFESTDTKNNTCVNPHKSVIRKCPTSSLGDLWSHLGLYSFQENAKIFANMIPKDFVYNMNNKMFCDENIYIFIRLFLVLSAKMDELYKDIYENEEFVCFGDFDSKRTRHIKNLLSDLDIGCTGKYNIFVALLNKLAENELGSRDFETVAGYMFGSSAYKAFSIANMIGGVSDRLIYISNSSRSMKYLAMFEFSLGRPCILTKDLVDYHKNVVEMPCFGEDTSKLFLLSCGKGSGFVYCSFVSRDEKQFMKEIDTEQNKWFDYIYSYYSEKTLSTK